MIRRLAPVVPLLLAGLLSGCATHRARPAGTGRTPVALVAAGTAFAQPGFGEALRAALSARLERPVVVVAVPAAPEVGALAGLGRRLARRERALAAYDWREPQCASEGDARIAIHYGADAVVHARLDWTADTAVPARPLLERLRRGDVEAMERLAGTLTLVAFAGPGTAPAVPVAHAGAPRLDAARAAAIAAAAVPPPPAPDWPATARRLIGAGCPLLGVAVAETRAPGGPDASALRARGVAAMRAGLGRTAARRLARETTAEVERALRDGDVETAAAAVARYAAHPTRAARTLASLERAVATARASRVDAPPAPDDRLSCTALCGMHMIELCNNDRSLWSAHRRSWEATPCGLRRDESFLRDCYQQQWLTGTFDEACVAPCEQAPAGRERLLHMLRSAGCVRAASS